MRTSLNCMFVALWVCLLAACAGVPISTMWKMHGFGPADFSALDAGYIRTAVQLPSGIDLKGHVTTLSINLTRQDGQAENLAMPLQRIAEGQTVDAGLDPAPAGKHWLLFALTEPGMASFQHLQTVLRADHDAYKAISMSVKFQFSDASQAKFDSKSALPVELWSRLRPTDGFFELYGGEIKFDTQRDKQ